MHILRDALNLKQIAQMFVWLSEQLLPVNKRQDRGPLQISKYIVVNNEESLQLLPVFEMFHSTFGEFLKILRTKHRPKSSFKSFGITLVNIETFLLPFRSMIV